MAKYIHIEAYPSETKATMKVAFSDLGTSENDWYAMTEDAKKVAIQEYLDSSPNELYWFPETITVKDNGK